MILMEKKEMSAEHEHMSGDYDPISGIRKYGPAGAQLLSMALRYYRYIWFDRSFWTIAGAEEWLAERGLSSSDMRTVENRMCAVQPLNKEESEYKGEQYTSRDLSSPGVWLTAVW
jgi:hypothetical protein